MSDYWYNALSLARSAQARTPAGDQDPSAPEPSAGPPLEPADEAGAVAGPGGGEAAEAKVAALLEHQARELHRLARENERLMDRIETLLRLQEREQVLRQQLQTRIDRMNEQIGPCGPAGEREAMCRQIREALSEELKPVLLAIVELLELALGPSGAPREAPREAPRPSLPEPPSAEEVGKLPEILLRPIEDLIGSSGRRPRRGDTPNGTKDPEAGAPAAKALRTGEQPGAVQPEPGRASPWTTVFT